MLLNEPTQRYYFDLVEASFHQRFKFLAAPIFMGKRVVSTETKAMKYDRMRQNKSKGKKPRLVVVTLSARVEMEGHYFVLHKRLFFLWVN